MNAATIALYISLHAGNEATTDYALQQPGTAESHTWLGMRQQGPRIGVHAAMAISQILLDKELSKPQYPKWERWTLRIVSVGIQGWAMSRDLAARDAAKNR